MLINFKIVFCILVFSFGVSYSDDSNSIMHPPGKSGEVLFDLNADNYNQVITELVENPKDSLPILVFMMLGECTVG